jgi:hypothetical protein
MVTALAMFRTSNMQGKIQRRPIRPAFAAQPSSKQPKVKVLKVNNRPIPGH